MNQNTVDRMVVLVIDDDDIGRALISKHLPPNAQVIEMASPIGATREASQARADVVVLDLEMPNLRGDALARLFRTNARLKHVGVVLVSGCRQAELSVLAQQCGADSWLPKSALPTELSAVVTRVCQTARARAQVAAACASSARAHKAVVHRAPPSPSEKKAGDLG